MLSYLVFFGISYLILTILPLNLDSRQAFRISLFSTLLMIFVNKILGFHVLEKFQSYCRAPMDLQSCWDTALLPTSTPTVTITPTVPLVLPKSELPLYYQKKCGQIDCTNDLECNYPLKCCHGECKEPMMVDHLRGNNLFVPQRMNICPPPKIHHKCSKTSDCQSCHLTCQEGRCHPLPTMTYGGLAGC